MKITIYREGTSLRMEDMDLQDLKKTSGPINEENQKHRKLNTFISVRSYSQLDKYPSMIHAAI